MYNPSPGYLSKIYYNYFGYFQVKFFLVIFFFLSYYTKSNRTFLLGDPKYWVSSENTV